MDLIGEAGNGFLVGSLNTSNIFLATLETSFFSTFSTLFFFGLFVFLSEELLPFAAFDFEAVLPCLVSFEVLLGFVAADGFLPEEVFVLELAFYSATLLSSVLLRVLGGPLVVVCS